MSGRPWLEALKSTIRERRADTNEAPEQSSKTLSPEGCKRCESSGDVPSPVLDAQTTEKVYAPWGEEERRLIAAGWEPKERCGKVIWKLPENEFYYSRKVALYFLDSGIVSTAETGAGQDGR
jgi:hypothetical protein